MSKFCGTCGAPLTEGAGFCGSCGTVIQRAVSPTPQASPSPQAAAVPQPPASSSYQTVNPSPQPPVQAAAPRSSIQPEPQLGSRSAPGSGSSSGIAPAPIPVSSSNLWVKVAIAAVVIIFVGGAAVVGGVWYVAHKVSEKAHAYSRSVLGDSSPTATSTETSSSDDSVKSTAISGDPCRLLSKEDVSKAIGVTILETKSTADGCSYLAKGSIADMTSKHLASMVGSKGADKKTQGMAQMFAGVIGNSMPKEKNSETESAQGNAVVFGFMVDNNSAKAQMKLNSKVLGSLGGGSDDGAIDGIGDEAFSKADGMMFVRKGDKLIRFMYTSCPCGTEEIKPLAKELADSL